MKKKKKKKTLLFFQISERRKTTTKMSTEEENSDFPRNDTSFSDYFPSLKSLDALISEFDETAKEVQTELEELKAADEEEGDDAEYWGLLYQSLSFDEADEDSVDSNDLGIDKVLAKKETRDNGLLPSQMERTP